MNILIKQGRIITPNKDFIGDIYISNGKITNIDTHISGVQQNVIILDARNKLVIPGGIDAHVHMHLYTPAGYSSDDFYTGSLAALRGGTTSMIDFVTPNKHQSLIEALKERIKEANNALCNYRFHMSITSWDEHTAEEMKQCVEQYGIRSFKTYLAYKGSIGIEYDELEKVMQTAYKLNALVTVHAEEGDIILENQHKFIQNGQTSPYYHALSRPADVEAKAVEKVITLSEKTGCTTYIVHTSAADSIKKIKAAQKRGIPIYAETCPQYLLLNEQVYQKAIDEALKYVISPPIRNTTDQQELWKAIAEGVVSVIATDHCPFNTYGQKDVGLTNFTKIPNGAGGVEQVEVVVGGDRAGVEGVVPLEHQGVGTAGQADGSRHVDAAVGGQVVETTVRRTRGNQRQVHRLRTGARHGVVHLVVARQVAHGGPAVAC